MGRPPKIHKPDMTTIAITKDCVKLINLRKWKGKTKSDFLQQALIERDQFKEEKLELEERLQDISKLYGDHNHLIQELKSIAGVHTDEELKSKLRNMRETIIIAN